MAINRVEIRDFLVFKGEFTADFCPGVNVLIGGNGTGKTTLLKCQYIAVEQFNAQKRFEQNPKHNSADDYFLNFYAKSYSFTYGNSNYDWKKYANQVEKYTHCTVDDVNFVKSSNHIFIPAKDILEHSKGLLALNNKREIPFDQTYIDILSNAEIGETHTITPNAAKVLDTIKKIIGGEVLYENDTFYIISKKNKTPFSLEASGYRKLGLLWKLLRNGLLEKGTVLFWDEPENSLNPELVPKLVEILLELSRNGVQIFLATHSEILSSYFSVLKKKEDSVMFYSLYKDGGRIKYDSNDRFDLLNPNKLTEAPIDLYKKKLDRGLGDD
jgi:predicted ATP-dependent endonuclease of OLD family